MNTPQVTDEWLLLALTPGIGPIYFLKLLNAFGSAQAAVNASPQQTEPLIGAEAAKALQERAAQSAVDMARQWEQAEDCQLITLQDADYPILLAESSAPPPLLFARGRRELLQTPKLAIVGSRAATAQGQKTAQQFAYELAGHGYAIVSGLASGIDAAAHNGALSASHASTIAIIGTGIDQIYPASNRKLAYRIMEQGLILSEFALGLGPIANHFPRRNRVIAGLSQGCLVVEARLNSGSLITARLALENNREVMAIPGSIHHPHAHGCHRLIKDGAKLVETVDDVLDEVGHLGPVINPKINVTIPFSEHPLLNAMGFDPITVDELANKLPLSAGELYTQLLELELNGQVASLPGGRFQTI